MPTISYCPPTSDGIIWPSMPDDYLRNPADILSVESISSNKGEKLSVPNDLETKRLDELYGALRNYLIFGKLIGLVPVIGLFQKDYEKIHFRKTSPAATISLTLAIVLFVNVAVAVIALASGKAMKAYDHAWAPAMLVFYATGLFIFIYFYNHLHEFLRMIHNWNSLRLHFTEPDVQLQRDITFLASAVMLSGVAENALVHLKQFPVVPQTESHVIRLRESPNMTALEVYYVRSHGQWAEIIPFHASVAIFVFISNKVALYAWNYLDITIIVLARALYFRFKTLFLLGEASLCRRNENVSKWRQFAKDHEELCRLVQDINIFLSPLIFVSYATNVYFVCLQFNLSLNPSGGKSTLSTVYAAWSFLHLIARMFLVSMAGARVNEWAHKVVEIFRRCPNEKYSKEVQRQERFVSTNIVGLSGFRCFFITKPLMLRIIGVVFTFEIVLLQTSQTAVRIENSI